MNVNTVDWNDFKALGMGTLYATVAIFGMVGGGGAGLHYVMRSKNPRLPFVIAYTLIGGISSVACYAASLTFDIFVAHNINELILRSMFAGVAVSLALFTGNYTVKIICEKLGVEIQITARKKYEERRGRDDSDQTIDRYKKG